MIYDGIQGDRTIEGEEGLECNGYSECRYFDNVMNGNNISEYIDLVYESDGTTYSHVKSMIPIFCNGRTSCFFTNIVIDPTLNSTDSTNTNTNEYRNYNVFLAYDGYQSCSNILSYIKLTDNNISSSLMSTSSHSSYYSVNVRFTAADCFYVSVEKELEFDSNIDTNDNSNSVNNFYNDYSEILCAGDRSCEPVESFYCYGYWSCDYATITNVRDNIWMYAQESACRAVIDGVRNDMHIGGTFGCYLFTISNVDIYSVASWALKCSTITNVTGELLGVRQGIILCDGDRCCVNSKLYSIHWIEARRDKALTYSKIFSEMTHCHHNGNNIHNSNYNNFLINNSNDDNKHNTNNNNRTMTVLLYGSNEELTIYDSYGDICRIVCFSEDACLTVDLYCNGTCLVDCDDDAVTYECPVVKLSDCSVWYSTISDDSSDDGNNTGGNGNEEISGDSGGDSSDTGLTLYDTIVSAFIWMTVAVAGLIIILVCSYQCRKVYCVQLNNFQKERTKIDRKKSVALSMNDCDESGTGSSHTDSIKDDIVIVDDDHDDEKTPESVDNRDISRSTTTRVIGIWSACCGYRSQGVNGRNTNSTAGGGLSNLNWILFSIKIYFCHSVFVVFAIVFVVCIFLAMTRGLYGFGQITQLVLSNYWCEKRDLDVIYAHSIEYGLNEGTNDGSTQFKVNINAFVDSELVYTTTTDFNATNIS